MAASLPLQSIPEPLRQPMTVALLASLVIHGLVGVSFSTTPPEVPKPKSGVQVVELTPAEQGRLPQATTQAPLPLPSMLPPLATNPLLPNLKSPNSTLPDNSLYTIPYAPPPPIPWYWQPPLRQAPAGNQARRQTNQPRPNNRPSIQGQAPARQFPTSPQTGQQYSLADGIKFGASDPVTDNTTTTPTTPPTNPSRPNQTRPDKIAAATVEQLRQLRQQKREGTGFDGTGTSPAEASDLLNQWLSQVDNPVAQENMQNIKLVANAAPNQQSGVVSVAVLVDAQGKIVGDPTVIQSSGYKAINQAAIATVKGHSFEPAATDRVYLIRVEVNSQAGPANSTPSEDPS